MRSNIFVLAVFVLISSTWAAPLTNRPAARRSLSRRSTQAILSRSSDARCRSEHAKGSLWTEEACSKMPHATGFKTATGDCQRPSSEGTVSGTCYIDSIEPISRVYRRMISQDGPPNDAVPKISPPSEPPSSATSQVTASSTTSPDTTASPPSATPTEDPKAPVPPSEPAPGGPTPKDGPEPVPSPPIPGTSGGGPAETTNEGPQPQDASPSKASAPSSAKAPPVAEEVAPPVSPVQAPFAAPKPKPSPTSASKEAVQGSHGSPVSTSSNEATSTPAANVPISHGTQATWGGTLVNTINGVHSPLAGARKAVNQKPMKLKTVVGTLFFDLVYGRFLF